MTISTAPGRARRLTLTICFALLALSASQASAADKELLDILLENKAINEAQYEDLLKKEELSKKDVNDISIAFDDGALEIKSADGDFAMEIGGRMHAQASAHSGNLPDGVDATDGTEFRRGRLELNGRFHKDYIWASEMDFADNEVAIKDFWLGYDGLESTTVMLGHQKQPYSLNLEMSSNDIPFIERSIDNDLNVPFVDRAIGIRANTVGEHWFFAAGAYGESMDANKDDDEGWGLAARLVVAPVISENQVLHLGIRGAYRQPKASDKTIRVKDETTHMSNLNIIDTGGISMVHAVTLSGAEAAYVYGPFWLFGEYNHANIDRKDGAGELSFGGWHLASTLNLTGETRAAAYRLDEGEFKGISPLEKFNPAEGTYGAWELALRLASLDLNDKDIAGGDEKVLTSAVNWYLNDTIRFMMEWSRIIDTDGSSELRRDAEDMDIYQFRTQYAF